MNTVSDSIHWPIYIRAKMFVGGRPLLRENFAETNTHTLQKRRFPINIRS